VAGDRPIPGQESGADGRTLSTTGCGLSRAAGRERWMLATSFRAGAGLGGAGSNSSAVPARRRRLCRPT
jgi:hypothetical protein